MAPRRFSRRIFIVAVAFGMAGSLSPAVAQERVGVNSAVNPAVTGTPPGGTARQLRVNEDVVFNERIATSAEGQTQILFLDQSAMTVGPDADLTINEFVYDRTRGTGKVAMSTARGIFRYVGGKVAKQGDSVTLKTPLATIAVRGGVFLANQVANGRLDVYFVYGNEVTVSANGVTQSLRRPGFAITVAGPGASPSAPYRTEPGTLAALEVRLDGRPGGNGGAPVVPTAGLVAASGIGNAISGDFRGSLQAAAQSQPQTGTPALLDPTDILTDLQVNSIQAQSDRHLRAIFQIYVPGAAGGSFSTGG